MAPSKFRNVDLVESKNSYRQLKVSDPSLHSLGVISNGKSVVFATGASTSGRLAVMPVDTSEAANDKPLSVTADNSNVTAFAFSRVRADVLLTGSRDGTLRVFVNDGFCRGKLAENVGVSDAVCELGKEHKLGTVHAIVSHPSADGVYVVCSKKALSLVHVDLTANTVSIVGSLKARGLGKDFVDAAFAPDGARVMAVCKDGARVLCDPRGFAEHSENASGSFLEASDGAKLQRVFYLPCGRYLALGTNRFRENYAFFFDPLSGEQADSVKITGFSSGAVLACHDPVTGLLALTLRGASTLRIFDVSQGTGSSFTALTSLNSQSSRYVGLGVLPKHCIDTDNFEVLRLFKLTANSLVPISIRVPRRAGACFDAAVFPPCAAPENALTASQYLVDKMNKEAPVHLFGPQSAAATTPAVSIAQASTTTTEKRFNPRGRGVTAAEKKLQQAKQQDSEEARRLAEEARAAEERRAALDKRFTQSTLLHTSGSEEKSKDAMYTHWNVSRDNSRSLVVNEHCAAAVWTTVGGNAVGVVPLSKLGRLPAEWPLVRAHAQKINMIALSGMHTNLLATASDDGTVKVFDMPIEEAEWEDHLVQNARGSHRGDFTEPLAVLKHSGKVVMCRFHDQVPELLVTASAAFGAKGHVLSLWNARTGELIVSTTEHKQRIWDAAFNFDGSLVATSCKDGFVRIFDARTLTLKCQFAVEETVRDGRVLFADTAATQGEYKLVSAGFARRNLRRVSAFVIDGEATGEIEVAPLATTTLDTSNAPLVPFFDRDTSLLFVLGAGESQVNIMELCLRKDAKQPLQKFGGWRADTPCATLAFRHKMACDVRRCQVATALKLTHDFSALVPVSFTVPRKRKDLFQDDLFPPTRANQALYGEVEDWLEDSAQEVKPVLVSLRPADMQLLSENALDNDAELARMRERAAEMRKQHREAEAAKKKYEEQLHKYDHLKDSAPIANNRWDAKLAFSDDEVDEDEWSD